MAPSATCEDLTDPADGEVSINDASRVEGSTATYTCNAGFLMSGSSQRVCQESGMWSGVVPICLGIHEYYDWLSYLASLLYN